MKFRKKPVIIEAVQFAEPFFRVKEFCRGSYWLKAANGLIVGLIIPTLEGDMTASPGDWIIKGVRGEFYPCRGDIFHETYEPVD